MRFGTWIVRSLYRPGSLATVASKLLTYKLDLVGIQEVTEDQWGILNAEGLYFLLQKINENHPLGTKCFVQHRTITSVELFVTECHCFERACTK
jgi:hypothetical protein